MASYGPPLKPRVKGYCCDSACSSEGLYLPQSKTPEGRIAGLSDHTNLAPQNPGREAENPGSGLPLHKYRRGRGSSGELTQGFHPREAHFRGMWLFPHLDRSPPLALCGCAEPWIDRHVPSDPFVLFWSCVSVRITLPGPDIAVGRSGWVSTHMVFCYNPNTVQNCIKRADRGDLGKTITLQYFCLSPCLVQRWPQWQIYVDSHAMIKHIYLDLLWTMITIIYYPQTYCEWERLKLRLECYS